MNDTQPDTPASAKPASNASKYLFMVILGLVLGAIATVMVVRAIESRSDPFPDAVMNVQQWHLGKLRGNVDANRCGATDTLPHVRALREMANDLDPAFPDLRDDARFSKASSSMRATLDTALATPPLNCAGVEKLVADIGGACKACHQDFR
ncbi:cytochrome c [Lysobacter sp. SG-8]|uniref:Cytochrome c n=1 Tax=Marilutibacter penaei TaxID=2759900 RepID=A0A7W3U564_9GAMM|nr:cytochrome c [Lysobacter penaei]MBB1089164.1 cytochrome c [Lysobacter penaei]